MGKKILLVLAATFFALATFPAHAEPAPWGLVVNEGKCAAWWGGDECTYFKAPFGWIQLYGEKIKFGGKECDFKVGQEKRCCEQLGLKFVPMKHEKDLTVKLPDMCGAKGKK